MQYHVSHTPRPIAIDLQTLRLWNIRHKLRTRNQGFRGRHIFIPSYYIFGSFSLFFHAFRDILPRVLYGLPLSHLVLCKVSKSHTFFRFIAMLCHPSHLWKWPGRPPHTLPTVEASWLCLVITIGSAWLDVPRRDHLVVLSINKTRKWQEAAEVYIVLKYPVAEYGALNAGYRANCKPVPREKANYLI